MTWPFAIFAMFAVMMLAMLLSNRRPSGTGQNDVTAEGPSPRERELEDEVKDLRERLKVLERIATEDRAAKRLSFEIEQLRDD